jgi:anti-anti-sigma factor
VTEFATHERAGVVVIEAEGRLDALVAPRFDETLKQVLDSGHVRVVVDFTKVTYISSSCLRLLLLGARRTREQHGDLKLCCLAPRVRQVFTIAGFDLVFELWEHQEQALVAFSTPTSRPGQPCSSA